MDAKNNYQEHGETATRRGGRLDCNSDFASEGEGDLDKFLNFPKEQVAFTPAK